MASVECVAEKINELQLEVDEIERHMRLLSLHDEESAILNRELVSKNRKKRMFETILLISHQQERQREEKDQT